MYDSNIGRFLSKDPLIVEDSALEYNPYLYCGNNPINRKDPSGKIWHIVGGAVIGGVVGAAGSIIVQAATKKKINWKDVGKAALVGTVSGAVYAGTLGAGMIVAGAVSGGVSGGLRHALDNGKKTTVKGMVTSVAVGATVGAVTSYAGSRLLASKNIHDVKMDHNIDGGLGVHYKTKIHTGNLQRRALEFHTPKGHKAPHDHYHWQINQIKGASNRYEPKARFDLLFRNLK